MNDNPSLELHADPSMDSAGAELMALAFRLEEHPEFAADAARVREIGAWASTGRMSDMEKSLIAVVGSMVRAIRDRNLVFHDDLPMKDQFISFLENLPDPLPGQPGYVDQNTLPPLERRDTFEAEVDIGEVRQWTAADNIERAIAPNCNVRPLGGQPGEAMIYAEGDQVSIFAANTTCTLKLRCYGGALRVEK